MSERFLKYETEINNPLVDENGVLKSDGNENTQPLYVELYEEIGTFSHINSSFDQMKDAYLNGREIIIDKTFGIYNLINSDDIQMDFIRFSLGNGDALSAHVLRFTRDNTIVTFEGNI